MIAEARVKTLAVLIFAVLLSDSALAGAASPHRAPSAFPQPTHPHISVTSSDDVRGWLQAAFVVRDAQMPQHRVTRRTRRVVDGTHRIGKVSAASPSTIQRYALSLVGSAQFTCLRPMWERESHWNPNDRNPESGAYGIAQFLPSTWEDLGLTPTANPRRQVDAGLLYIRQRYGSPCGAWAFWQQHKWY